jgi:hypothetical protein
MLTLQERNEAGTLCTGLGKERPIHWLTFLRITHTVYLGVFMSFPE